VLIKSKDAGVNRESLYKVLKSGAKTRFETIKKLMTAIGVELTVQPIATLAAASKATAPKARKPSVAAAKPTAKSAAKKPVAAAAKPSAKPAARKVKAAVQQ
jgi:predicted transcriptional regulator